MIDEKLLINKIKAAINDDRLDNYKPWAVLYEVADMIWEMPKVGEWIPCNERLPEDKNEVLVTVSGKFGSITFPSAIQTALYNEIDGWVIMEFPDLENPDVTAWQPLPEPWEE